MSLPPLRLRMVPSRSHPRAEVLLALRINRMDAPSDEGLPQAGRQAGRILGAAQEPSHEARRTCETGTRGGGEGGNEHPRVAIRVRTCAPAGLSVGSRAAPRTRAGRADDGSRAAAIHRSDTPSSSRSSDGIPIRAPLTISQAGRFARATRAHRHHARPRDRRAICYRGGRGDPRCHRRSR